MPDRFDDIFAAARQGQQSTVGEEPLIEDVPMPEAKPQPSSRNKKQSQTEPTAKPTTKTSVKPAPTSSPWADLEAEEREPTIRLNLDIPLALNDKLAEKARKLRKSKADLVRHLLEWSLNE